MLKYLVSKFIDPQQDMLVQQWRNQLTDAQREGAPRGEKLLIGALDSSAVSPQDRGIGPKLRLGDGAPGSEDLRAALNGIRASATRQNWYPCLQSAMEGVPERLTTMTSMTASQWKLWLDAHATKLGVNKDETEWACAVLPEVGVQMDAVCPGA